MRRQGNKVYRVQCRFDNDIELQATVSLDSKPLVDLYQGHDTEMTLRPVEAERLGRALFKAAADARAKVKR